MADFLLLDTTDFLLLDASGDLLVLEGDAPIADKSGPGGSSRRRKQIVQDDDEEIMRVVHEFLRTL